MSSRLLDALADRVLIYDGAMGTQIQGAGLADADFVLRAVGIPDVDAAAERLGGKVLDGCNELLNFTRPELIQEIHERYLEAGADLIETNTFGSTSIVLAEYDIAELVYATSRRAAATCPRRPPLPVRARCLSRSSLRRRARQFPALVRGKRVLRRSP